MGEKGKFIFKITGVSPKDWQYILDKLFFFEGVKFNSIFDCKGND
jgi:hypothetical protein